VSSAYAKAALLAEVDLVRGAAPGGRKMATYRAARALGQFVGGGLLDRDLVYPALLAAAQQVGLASREAREHIGRGLRKGMARPRRVPEAAHHTASAATVRSANRPRDNLRSYLPRDEIRRFWDSCVSVTGDEEVAAYLHDQRAIDPEAVHLWDLARAMPPALNARWAWSKEGAWAGSGHRLVLPLYDGHGEIRGFRARRIATGDGRKTLAPAGATTVGLVFTCPLTRQVLRSGLAPDWWPDTPLGLWIVEGDIDFLTVASGMSECRERAPGVLGVFSGSWESSLASRIPPATEVVLMPHPDRTGRDYMSRIGRSLSDTCHVRVRSCA
jgi:hypothetical protein